jgi:hypothetical protein
LKRILPFLLCISLACNGYFLIQKTGEQKSLLTQAAVNQSIQVVAKRPYIPRGEVGVLALRCSPNNNCRIVCSYKVNGKDFTTTRNIPAGNDGSVLCTWKVDKNTDTGTYEIEVVCGSSRLVTNYTVQ